MAIVSDPEGSAARLLRSVWVLPVALGIVLVVLILASVKWRYNRFELHAKTASVALTASVAYTLPVGRGLPLSSEVAMYELSTADFPKEFADLVSDDHPLRISAKAITLDKISLSAGGVLRLVADDDGQHEIQVSRGSISLTFQGEVSGPDGAGGRHTLTTADTPIGLDIMPRASDTGVRVVLPKAAVVGLTLADEPINGIAFARPRFDPNDSRPPFQSDIVGGTLKLLDTGEEFPLRARELLWFGGVDATVSQVTVTDSGIDADMFGRARSIGIGPPRTRQGSEPDRDVTPSWLAFIYGQHQLKLVWLVVAAAILALWRARQWAFNWKTKDGAA